MHRYRRFSPTSRPTTLLDHKTYPAQDLRDLYLGRWRIEELYKISKQLMTVQDFHGQSGRGVKQELYAHFILITLTRLFSNRGEDRIKASRPGDTKPAMQANFKNSLTTVARNIEGLLLQQAAMLSETVTRIVATIAACRQRVHPNRSYPRRSRKPLGKWQPARVTRRPDNQTKEQKPPWRATDSLRAPLKILLFGRRRFRIGLTIC